MKDKKTEPQGSKNLSDRTLPEKSKHTSNQNIDENGILEIRSKLDDPEYMDFAIYRLAVIITEKIFSLRGYDGYK